METKKLLVIAGFTLLSVIGSGYLYETQFASLEPPTPQEQPEIEVSYSNATGELELEIIDGQFTKLGSGHVKLSQGDANFTLEGYGERKETNYWAKHGFLSLDSEGLTRFPIREGENIRFKIEDVEPITIKTVDRGEEVNSHNIVFEDCQPKVYAEIYVSGNKTQINEAGDCFN